MTWMIAINTQMLTINDIDICVDQLVTPVVSSRAVLLIIFYSPYNGSMNKKKFNRSD